MGIKVIHVDRENFKTIYKLQVYEIVVKLERPDSLMMSMAVEMIRSLVEIKLSVIQIPPCLCALRRTSPTKQTSPKLF